MYIFHWMMQIPLARVAKLKKTKQASPPAPFPELPNMRNDANNGDNAPETRKPLILDSASHLGADLAGEAQQSWRTATSLRRGRLSTAGVHLNQHLLSQGALHCHCRWEVGEEAPRNLPCSSD
jgi:hypothetical protein